MKKVGKAILGGLKSAGKGAWAGLKIGAKYGTEYGPLAASILAGLGTGGIPVLVLQALKGGMAVAEARGGKNKSAVAIAVAIQAMKQAGIPVPAEGALRMAIEALHDPNVKDGEFEFNLEEAAARSGGVTDEEKAAIDAELKRIKEALLKEIGQPS